MSYSKKAVINHNYVKANGNSTVYLRVIINRKKKDFDLDIEWPAKYFDQVRGLMKARSKEDADHIDYNELITQAYADANDIFKRYRLARKPLTIELFSREWQNRFGSGDIPVDSFTAYFLQKNTERYKRREIEYYTWKSFNETYKMLRKFAPVIEWEDFHPEWANEFDAWLKRQINGRRKDKDTTNTRWLYHKNVRRIMNLARKNDRIAFIYPYEYFQFGSVPGTWRAIYEESVKKIYAYYKQPNLPNLYRKAARVYLFGLGTGLRKSDLRRVTRNWLQEGMLVFTPQKMKKRGREIELPLRGFTLEMFQDAAQEAAPNKPLFADFHENTYNEAFKHIAKELGIEVNLHYHTTRHTFITLYMKNGGPVDVLMEYTGIKDYKTLAKYNHIDRETKRKNITIIDKFMSSPDGAV